MEFQQRGTEMSSPNEPYKNLSFTTLSSLEFEALNSLDESIRYHETNVVDENVQSCKEMKIDSNGPHQSLCIVINKPQRFCFSDNGSFRCARKFTSASPRSFKTH